MEWLQREFVHHERPSLLGVVLAAVVHFFTKPKRSVYRPRPSQF